MRVSVGGRAPRATSHGCTSPHPSTSEAPAVQDPGACCCCLLPTTSCVSFRDLITILETSQRPSWCSLGSRPWPHPRIPLSALWIIVAIHFLAQSASSLDFWNVRQRRGPPSITGNIHLLYNMCEHVNIFMYLLHWYAVIIHGNS